MSYNDDDLKDELGFSAVNDEEGVEDLEPLEGATTDFRFDEEPEEDPEDRYH